MAPISSAASTELYDYDDAGRLSTVSDPGGPVQAFTYDSTGAMTTRGVGLLATWFTSDGHGRPVSSNNGIAASWSTDGELISLARPSVGGSSSFSYDGFGRIRSITTPSGTTGTYSYDGLGRRVSLKVAGAIQRRYLYGGSLFPRAWIDGDGEVLERYVYGASRHVPELILRRDGQRLRLVTDLMGSVRAVIDIDTGAVVQRLAYDAYGNTTYDTAPNLDQPFGFKGSLSDPITESAGVAWMGVRAYVPSLARFATPDPEGIAAAWNEHDAFAGDPVNLSDPDGLIPEWTETVITRYAAFWDGFTFGATAWVRRQAVDGDPVDRCRWDYQVAYGVGGFTFGAMVGAAGGAGAAAAAAASAGARWAAAGAFVIGRYPAYTNFASATGSAFFSLGGAYGVLPGIRTLLNYVAIRGAVRSGKPIVQIGSPAPGGALAKELEWIEKLGGKIHHRIL